MTPENPFSVVRSVGGGFFLLWPTTVVDDTDEVIFAGQHADAASITNRLNKLRTFIGLDLTKVKGAELGALLDKMEESGCI